MRWSTKNCDFWGAEEEVVTRKHTHSNTQSIKHVHKSEVQDNTWWCISTHTAVIQIYNKEYIYGSVKVGSLPFVSFTKDASYMYLFLAGLSELVPSSYKCRSNAMVSDCVLSHLLMNYILQVPFESWLWWVEQSLGPWAHLILHGLVLSRQEGEGTYIQYDISQ